MYQEHPFVRSFVSDLGGHARSLNGFLLVLDDFKTKGKKPTYSTLSRALLHKLRRFGSGPLPAELIIRAVLRQSIHLDKVVGKLKETVESYVASVCISQ
jgi:hypothetical protein